MLLSEIQTRASGYEVSGLDAILSKRSSLLCRFASGTQAVVEFLQNGIAADCYYGIHR
jgi:hypothetical protein